MEAKTKKRLGLLLILAPVIGLVLILVGWAIASFVAGSMVSVQTPEPVVQNTIRPAEEPSQALVVMSYLNVILGFLGLLCVLGIIIGFPVGIVLLIVNSKKSNQETSTEQKRDIQT